jgi:hypothetical protein
MPAPAGPWVCPHLLKTRSRFHAGCPQVGHCDLTMPGPSMVGTTQSLGRGGHSQSRRAALWADGIGTKGAVPGGANGRKRPLTTLHMASIPEACYSVGTLLPSKALPSLHACGDGRRHPAPAPAPATHRQNVWPHLNECAFLKSSWLSGLVSTDMDMSERRTQAHGGFRTLHAAAAHAGPHSMRTPPLAPPRPATCHSSQESSDHRPLSGSMVPRGAAVFAAVTAADAAAQPHRRFHRAAPCARRAAGAPLCHRSIPGPRLHHRGTL